MHKYFEHEDANHWANLSWLPSVNCQDFHHRIPFLVRDVGLDFHLAK